MAKARKYSAGQAVKTIREGHSTMELVAAVRSAAATTGRSSPALLQTGWPGWLATWSDGASEA